MRRERNSNLQAGIVATILSLLTLGVFFVLQDYGPESAVRRFHQAAVSNDDRELTRVTEQPINSQEVQLLKRTIQQLVASGARLQLGPVSRQGNRVSAEFRYYHRDGVYIILWSVNRTRGGWQVDATATLRSLRGFMGM